MAKVGFWLKGARGKLAGSVLQKSATAGTIIRDKVDPKNPRTTGQAVIRASFAPAAKFYSPFSKVLEKSWEGKSKAESYQAFLKKAIQDCKAGGWWIDKGVGFQPLPYQVSNGTIPSLTYDVVHNKLAIIGTDDNEEFDPSDIDPWTVGGLSTIFNKLGYQDGMQITISFIFDTDGGFYPKTCRFILESESNVAIDWSNYGVTINKETDDPWKFESANGDTLIAGFMIASAYENGVWRRSTQNVAVDEDYLLGLQSAESYDSAVASYQDSSRAATIESDVYLNGSTSETSGTTGTGTANKLLVHIPFNGSENYEYLFNPSFATTHWPCATAYGKKGSPEGLASMYAAIKIGNKWLINKTTTSNETPSGISENVDYIQGNDPETKTWLLSKGVDPQLF